VLFANESRMCVGQLAARFHVSKYPTLKLFRFGALVKREYRGQRSASALLSFIRTQLVVPVTRLNTPEDIYTVDVSHIFRFVQLCLSVLRICCNCVLLVVRIAY